MESFDVGIRKYVEFQRLQYWLVIKVKPIDDEDKENFAKDKLTKKKKLSLSLEFINHPTWKIFILITILINTLLTFNVLMHSLNTIFLEVIVLVHLTCLFFWIDFIAAICEKVLEKKKKKGEAKTRKVIFLVIEAISLLPLSIIYLIAVPKPNWTTFWWLRLVTLLRFYRIPHFLSKLATAGKNHWKIFLAAYVFYLVVLMDIFANFYLSQINDSNFQVNIAKWNETIGNKFTVALYFSTVTFLNLGYGDIVPHNYLEMAACTLAMIAGCSILRGVITGAVASEFSNKEKRREIYRHEFGATLNILKERRIDKKLLEKISDNMQTIWKIKKGYTGAPPVHILPLSIQKEIYFDINFGLLNRSLIFSIQPRSFLRSVSLSMRNLSFLPGDIIMEPFGMVEAMLCVASGVIEILSEENDETVLFSLTSGSVLGEATLFMSIPIRCIIRAATYVELQVLMKVNFSRLALKYTDIYRSMRDEIYHRLNFPEDFEVDESIKALDPDFHELSRRKAAKRFLQDLKKLKKDESNSLIVYNTAILSLYNLSENIPRVKTLPINLIKSRPWILRPNTTFTELWELFRAIWVTIVVFLYPYCAAFVREITPEMYIFLVMTEVFYLVDLFLQCTIAIERNDHFTYVTSVKKIITAKLKTIRFYFDILAIYDFSIYAKIVFPKDPEYGYLLLSLNRVLKILQVHLYFIKLENKMSTNLLFVRMIKYMYYLFVAIVWAAVILYLEACPGENCIEDRWFSQTEQKEVAKSDPTPCTEWPTIVSMYWACITVLTVGYGDIVATAIPDCWVAMLCTTFGAVLVTVCMAQASSTFKHLARVRTYFQEELFAVDRFMIEHDIPKNLQLRVKDYFRSQWSYDKGFTMKQTLTTEGLPTQQRQIILTELMKTFLTVPFFQRATGDFLKLLTRSCRVRVLPPGEVITSSRTFVREMYILENGYCEVSYLNEETLLTSDVKVIGPVNCFGHLEMILGMPLLLNVQTLTHCRIISLDYSSYLRAITKFPSVKVDIETIVDKDYIESKSKGFDSLGFKVLSETDLEEHVLKKQKELLSKSVINVYSYEKSLSKNYWEPFKVWGKFRFLQFLLLPFVIVPYSLFIKIWMSLRILGVLLLGLIAPIHFSLPNHTKELLIFVLIHQGFAWLDMYLMFHVAYYDSRGILMFHPAKTSTWYLKGNFIIDLITVFPFYLVIRALFPRQEPSPSLFHDAPGLIMVFQFYKFFQGCHYLENDILRRVESLKMLKFVPLAVIATNLVSGVVILLECYRYSVSHVKAPQVVLVAKNFQESIGVFCGGRNDSSAQSKSVSVFQFYLTAFYWVTSTMTGCGFGDLNAHDRTTMIAVIIIAVLGVFLYGYMFVELTSSMISVHNLVTKHRRRIMEMTRFMRTKKVPSDLQKKLISHYEYNWQRTEGASPQKTFTYVHAALRESIVRSMYEATIKKIPAFFDVEKPIYRIIGKYLDEVYFLRGETIIRYNDVQQYIYLIYRGRVDLLSHTGSVITTMGRGGLFGNISKKPFSLSSFIVVARKNVDILRLESNIFFKTLQVFPNTKSLVDFLTSRTEDYIRPLAETGSEESSTVRGIHEDTIPYEIAGMKNKFASFPSTPEVSLYLNSFYFRNSIYKPRNKSFLNFVILSDSDLHKTIGISVFILAFLSGTLTFYMFGFQDFSITFLVISYFLDFMFLLHIYFQFHFSYFDKYGDYVVSLKKIRDKYLKSNKKITYDILANIPLDLFVLAAAKDYRLASLSILRLNRVLRLRYIFKFYDSKFKVLMVNKIYLELSLLLVSTILMTHIFACIWYFASCPLDHCIDHSWVNDMHIPKDRKGELYIASVYYIITVITTTGYGDVPVSIPSSLLASIFFMILSQFAVVLLTGAMAAVINAHSQHLFLFQERIAELKGSFQRLNMSEYQITKMWNYVTSLWLQETGKQVPKFIKTAPYVMKCDVMNAMFGSHLSQSYVFFDTDEAFLRQLAIHLKRFVFFPGNYIVQQGDIDHTMYFIHKGEVSVLTIHPNLAETIHFTLVQNDHFGMAQGLTTGKPHQFSFRAETDVEILSLTLGHWRHLLRYFPDAGQKIYQRVESLPPVGDDESLA